MKLLFHCCCAPCAAASVESLCGEGITPTLFWYNPNIHPSTEYESRRDSLFAFAETGNLPLEKVDEYGLYPFLHSVGGEMAMGLRCCDCYYMRLARTAALAVELGFGAFGTSLLISPYQDHDLIRGTGDDVAKQHGMDFMYRDFRPMFRESQNQARANGFYMQKYCGCIFSEADRYKDKGKVSKQWQIP